MGQGSPARAQELFATALQHHRGGRLGAAEELYRRILQTDANHADALHLLGVLAHQTGRHELSVDLIGQAIARDARVPAFHNNLGNALMALGRAAEAEAAYRRALARKSDHADAHYNLGLALQAQDRLEEAVASYRRALELRPGHAESYNNLGNALKALGKPAAAEDCYRRALASRPGFADAHNNLGNVLEARGALEAAVASYTRALEFKPDHAQAHNNLGIALLKLGRPAEAVAACRRALLHRPDYVQAHCTLGHALRDEGEEEEARASYRRALALDPDYAVARLGLAIATIPIIARSALDRPAAVDAFTRSLDDLTAWSAAHPGKLGEAVGTIQPFYLAYDRADVTAVLCRYGDLASAEAAAYWQPRADGRRRIQPRRERLRMIVVSGQVREHPVWEMILRGFIAHIDRAQFEVIVYHTCATADAETAWAMSHVDRFVQGPRPVKSWLDELEGDRPDVLFYPEVGMDPATCTLAALRLAPLQIAAWGHPITTGLPTIDRFVSGELLEGARAEQHYREGLVRLPGTGVCTSAAAIRTQPWGGPDRPRDTVRFALCHQPTKFSPADDRLLARIAKAAGPCEFWLATPANLPWAQSRLRDRLAAAFRAEGLDPDASLRTTAWLSRDRFSSFLDDMDIHLDCPAFSGYTTAWQAIHRGLPTITVEGEFLRQRLAAGLLRQIGLPEGIAASDEEYLATAMRWAQECRQAQRWASRRDALRQAAPAVDDNRAAVTALAQMLLEASG